MFLNSPDTRKTHVIRIFGTNRAGDILKEMWLDVERMDEWYIVNSGDGIVQSQGGNPVGSMMGQLMPQTMKWQDDPQSDRYLEDGNDTRDTTILKICDPTVTTDFDDPDEWIPLRVNDRIIRANSRDNFQKYVEHFQNTVENQSRKFTNKRVIHRDTNIDDAADAVDDGVKAYVVDLADDNKQQYEMIDGTEDTSQYVEFSVLEEIGHANTNDASRVGGGTDRKYKLLNQYLLDMFEDAKLEEVGSSGINPPYLLDPYQNIVNVNWGSVTEQFLLGLNAPSTTGTHFTQAEAEDGTIWADKSFGASGLGLTVISAGCIAFGYVTDSNGNKTRCFMRAQTPSEFGHEPRKIYMGTVFEGELTWSEVYEVPDNVVAVSFANDAFFISYPAGIVVTRDGQSFVDVGNPFGSFSLSTPPTSVAYLPPKKKSDPGIYCCVASVAVSEISGDVLVSGFSLAWATSRNGTSWSADYQPDVFLEPGGVNAIPPNTSITVGNGKFYVAGAGKHTFSDEEGEFVLSSAAVYTSIDGRSWAKTELPGSQMNPSRPVRVDSSFGIVFVRDPTVKGTKGYFIVTAQSTGGPSFTDNSRVYRSYDGLSWTQIRSMNSDVFDAKRWNVVTAISKKTTDKIVLV